MKTIKILLLLTALGLTSNAEAQFLKRLKKRAAAAAEETIIQKVEQKTADKTGKATDTVLDAPENAGKSKSGSNGGNNQEGVSENPDNTQNSGSEIPNEPDDISVYAKFDFVPGDKILQYDDFSTDAVGDFPSKWNTNGTGEIVLINQEKWFQIMSGSTYIPDLKDGLPEDYTIEFDMLTQGIDQKTSSQAKFEFWLEDHNTFSRPKNNVKVEMPLCQFINIGFVVENHVAGERQIRNIIERDVRSAILEKARISIAVNGKRFRLWVNESKVVDVPRLVPENIQSFKLFSRTLRDGGQDEVFITNVKIAEGGVDLRQKLLSEGKFSTTGILFDSGSDKIRPESYGALKQIAEALDGSGLKINIVGHTDADGGEDINQTLVR